VLYWEVAAAERADSRDVVVVGVGVLARGRGVAGLVVGVGTAVV